MDDTDPLAKSPDPWLGHSESRGVSVEVTLKTGDKVEDKEGVSSVDTGGEEGEEEVIREVRHSGRSRPRGVLQSFWRCFWRFLKGKKI